MSGFLAILGGPRQAHGRAAVDAAAAWLAPRSPDGLAGWRAEGATLVQGLLRLYPGQTAPPAVATLDGATWLVGDVRIDARDELRRALHSAGDDGDPAESDAELVLRAFRAWGEGCTGHLRGDFSFLVWDAPRGEAFFAIDHFGLRPLFHAPLSGGGVAVGNTLGALRCVPGVGEELDELGVADFLLFGMSMEAEGTLFSGIRRLPRGHRGRWSAAAGVRTEAYWTPSARPELRLRNGREYVEAFHAVLGAAVRDRVRDAPVSIEMSGGLDSTLLAAVAKRELRAAGMEDGVRGWCFSHASSFPDPEPSFARRAAEHLGVPLRVFDAGRVPALDPAPATRGAPLQPLASITHAVAREMIGHSRIALSGYDADALLRVSLPQVWRRIGERRGVGALRSAAGLLGVAAHNRRLPRLGLRSAARRRAQVAPQPPFPTWLREDVVAPHGLRARAAEVLGPRTGDGDDPRAAVRGPLQAALWADLFESYDPGSSGVAHVVMHPFMDLRVAAFLQSLPPVPWCIEKHLLRRAGQGLLPDEILRRGKTPLAADPLHSRAAEIARALQAPPAPEGVERWIEKEQLGPLDVADPNPVLWESARLASLARWLTTSARFGRPAGPVPVIDWKGTTHVEADW